MIKKGYIVYNKKEKEFLKHNGGFIEYVTVEDIDCATIFPDVSCAKSAIREYTIDRIAEYTIFPAISETTVKIV